MSRPTNNRFHLPLNRRIKDGRIFEVSNRRRNITYLRCSKYLCEGTAKVVGNQDIVLTHEHSPTICFEDRSAQLIADFKATLKSMLKTHYWELRVLYDTAVLLFDEKIKVLVPFNSIESSLKRWRKVGFPANPNTLKEWDEKLGRPENRRLLEYGAGTLVSQRITDSEGKSHILMYDPQFVESTFRNVRHILMDATYQSKPTLEDAYQLMTVLGVVYDHAIPFLHVLMASKTEIAYTAVMNEVSKLINSASVQVVMTDFEQALRKASQGVFSRAHITGCNVHYDRALLRKLKKLKLTNLIKENEVAKTFVKKMMALAFLPEDAIFVEYVGLTDSLPPELKSAFARFLQYFERQWLIVVKPLGFSVFGLSRRTNNVTESYNSVLAHQMGKHPSPWTFLVKLCKLTSNARDDVVSLRLMKKIKRHPRYSTQYKQKKLIQAWKELYTGAITGAEFLDQTASLKGHIRQRLQSLEDNPDNEEMVETPRNIPVAEDPDYDADVFEGLRYDDTEPARADGDNDSASLRSEENDVQTMRSEENDVQSMRSGENDVQSTRSGENDVQSTRSGENDVQSMRSGGSVISARSEESNDVRSVRSGGGADDELPRFGGLNNGVEPVISVGNNDVQSVITISSGGLNDGRSVRFGDGADDEFERPGGNVAEWLIGNFPGDDNQNNAQENERATVEAMETNAVVDDRRSRNVVPQVKASRSKKKNERKKKSRKRKLMEAQNADKKGIDDKPARPRGHKRRRKNNKKVTTCIICLKNEITHAFFPCGHHCSCMSCAALLSKKKKCPKCRAVFAEVIRIYSE